MECQNSVISYPVLVATSRSSPPQFEVRVDEVNYEHKKKNLSPPCPDSVTATDEHVPLDSPVDQSLPDRFPGKSKEEASAILLQASFRGYLVRFCLITA